MHGGGAERRLLFWVGLVKSSALRRGVEHLSL